MRQGHEPGQRDGGAGALDRILVVELAGGIPGAIAGMLLADNGARVVKVEPPGGAAERRHAGHPVWDRGKESLVLDLERSAEIAVLERLLARADVLVEACPSPGPWSRARGRGAGDRPNTRLVTCAISAYGPVGGLAALVADEFLVSARMGRVWGQYGWLPGPSYVALPVLSVGAALLAVQGVVASLLARGSDGVGQRVETSLFGAAFAMSTPVVGGTLQEEAHAWGHRPVGPSPFYSAFPCADGRWLHFGCIHADFVRRAIDALGIGAAVTPLAADPDFGSGMRIRSERLRDALFDIIERAVATRTCDDWTRILGSADVPVAPVREPQDYLDDPQARVNGIATVTDAEAGRVEEIGASVRLLGTPGRIHGAAPLPGAHTRSLLAEVDGHGPTSVTRADTSAVVAAPPTGAIGSSAAPCAPLEGLRVLEIASLIAGPMAGRFLADLGADVVKLEAPGGGDIARRNGSPAFLPLNAGKRGIVVDLKVTEGREIGHRLARWADVVIDNMRPGAAERLGMGWDELRGLNARLVYCHVTAYGSRGPYAQRPGLDPLAGALAGVEMRQGGASGKPVYLHFAAVDHAAALLACDGILMALVARERTGAGQRVETSLLDAAALLNADAIVRSERAVTAAVPRSQYGPSALRRIYETASGWIAVVAETEQTWRGLLRVLSADAPRDDARFATAAGRAADDEALAAALAGVFRTRTADAWLTALDGAGVPCASVAEDYEKAFHTDPEVMANDMVVERPHPGVGTVWLAHGWLRLSATPTRRPLAPPRLGEHTRQVLGEIGCSGPEIDALRERGVVSWEAAG